MTMFNVRLGWWLGNPGPEGCQTYRHEGPAIAILPLIHETLGLTTDDKPYVHVSDGGHFENLGLYEMVRRRCRLIVISDAGRDPDFAFEDLGNAVRKIAIDLGVPIRFERLDRLKRRPQDVGQIAQDCDYHAVAEIDYQERGRRRRRRERPDPLHQDRLSRHGKRGRAQLRHGQSRFSAPEHGQPVVQQVAVRKLPLARLRDHGGPVVPRLAGRGLCRREPSLADLLAALRVAPAAGNPTEAKTPAKAQEARGEITAHCVNSSARSMRATY